MSETPRFSRRDVLGGAAAVGAGLLIAPAAASAEQRSGNRVFGRRLVQLSGESPVIAPGRRFVLAGIEWAGPATARIEMRARSAGGSWSPWALASVRGHGPDRAAASAVWSGEPLWFGPADDLQLRSAGAVAGIRIQFVAASAVAARDVHAARPASAVAARDIPAVRAASAVAAPDVHAVRAAAFPVAEPVLPAGPGQPPIIARSAWAGPDHGPSDGPFYGAVRMAFVHHSDGPNGYSAAEVPAMILAIYIFHRFVRGWYDIGYNFVIDAFGRIWEARAGGIDEPVVGAQAGGYNAVSTGVCMLGTFMSQLPTAPALASLDRLLAWKLPLHGVPVLGKVQVKVDPADAFYTPFRPGQLVVLPRIAGHRDGDSTSCPGNDLYAQLPAVRGRVDRLVGSATVSSTLAAARLTVPPATPVALTGRLAYLDGSPVADAPLELQTVSGIGRETTFATVTTAADGTWSATLTPGRTVIVRALHAAAPAAVSDLVQIGLAPVITLSLVSGSPPRLAGTITPATRRVTLDVYALSGPHRHLALSRRVAVHRGAFSARLSLGRLRARGRYEVIARAAADRRTVAAASPPVTLPG